MVISPHFSFLAGQNPGSIFSLSAARADVLKADRADDRVDADELPVLKMPSREEIEADYAPGGLVNRMYPTYEPRDEQIAMAVEVRDALVTGTHRVIEAGTGVGKSMAYLVPFAEAARRNNITVGIATKSNNLADQLMYHELPKLAEQLDGGLSFCALKGYDHYPCLRKLERMSRGQVEITTKRDPADTLTAVAVIMAYVCQSADGDLDSLGIRWRSVNRPDFTTASRECARRLCPFFPDKCLVHGARRRAAHADVVVTNHSLLFRNVAAEGRILPPIRHWVVDEAHSIEREARRQWARVVSADESRVLFERLGGSSAGALSQVSRDLATSEGSTLYLGLTAKATSTVARASMAIADVFDGVRELGRRARGSYDNANLWIGPELRESDDWHDFLQSAHTAIDALDQADKSVDALVQTVAADKPEVVVDLGDISRRLHELAENLKLIIEGTDEHYVYSLQVNRRLRAGGESMTAERIDIGEALANEWLPEVHTAIFASATMTVSKSFEHFNHAVGLDRIGASTSSSLHLDSSYDFDSNMAVVVRGTFPIRAIASAISRRSSACWSMPISPWVDRCSRFSPTGAIWRTCMPVSSPNWRERAWSSIASNATRPRVACAIGLSTSRPHRSLRLRPFGRALTPAARRCVASLSPSCRSRAPRIPFRVSAICVRTAPGRATRCPRRCSRSNRPPAVLSAHRPIAACSSWQIRAW